MEISNAALLRRRDLNIIDIRAPEEQAAVGYIPGSIMITEDTLRENPELLRDRMPAVLVCMSGRRSLQILPDLHRAGFPAVLSLSGGVLGWGAAGLALCGDKTIPDIPEVNSVSQAMRELESCFVAESVERFLSQEEQVEMDGNPRELVSTIMKEVRGDTSSGSAALRLTINRLSQLAWHGGHDVKRIAVNVDRMIAMVRRLEERSVQL